MMSIWQDGVVASQQDRDVISENLIRLYESIRLAQARIETLGDAMVGEENALVSASRKMDDAGDLLRTVYQAHLKEASNGN